MAHVSSWLVIAFVIFFQDVEVQSEAISPNPEPPLQPPPMKPMVVYGANTDKDNLKGKMPWRIIPGGMPFNTDNDKYKPYIIYPPPKQWYPPKFGRPYFNKDWDPPKNKDDIYHRKKLEELDGVPKPKTADKIDDSLTDRNKVIEFYSIPGDGCRDGDNKILDDKAGCKTQKNRKQWGYQEPSRNNYCWGGRCEPQRRPWQSYSFIGSYPGSFPPGPSAVPDNLFPNSVAPGTSLDSFSPNTYPGSGYFPYPKPYKPYPYPYPIPYGYPYQFFFPYWYKKYPYYSQPGKPFFVKVEMEAPEEKVVTKKQESVTESVKNKAEKKTTSEEAKKIMKDPKSQQKHTPILP